MKRLGSKLNPGFVAYPWTALLLAMFAGHGLQPLYAQTTNQESVSQQVQQLTEAMAREQALIEQSQHQLDAMRKQLESLQRQMANGTGQPGGGTAAVATGPSAAASGTAQNAAAIEDIKERQALQESQIATHEQTKVESASKYPVKITGLLLLNGFVNTNAVDMPATPTVAIGGPGSTGASVRQTVLGIDARGPSLFGARSYANIRVDFSGSAQSSSADGAYSGYYNASATFLRLRTAHAGLQWKQTEAYFSLDRPIFSPDAPASLVAVAQPALAWSGNLWTWNPQLGVRQDLKLTGSSDLRFQASLMDVGNAPLTLQFPTSANSALPPSDGEQSRWPGVEARIALLSSKSLDEGSHFGVGGYFAPHSSATVDRSYDAWAGTLDTRWNFPAHLSLTGSFYRGLGLGGLGGGGYKDYSYRASTTATTGYRVRALDDVGGWAQLQEKFNERVQLNAAFGVDNVFSRELRRYIVLPTDSYTNLARNQSFTGNVIFSPSAYLLFSLEYRHLQSFPAVGVPSTSNIIGVAAGYKF